MTWGNCWTVETGSAGDTTTSECIVNWIVEVATVKVEEPPAKLLEMSYAKLVLNRVR
jgi:hypothetical protein